MNLLSCADLVQHLIITGAVDTWGISTLCTLCWISLIHGETNPQRTAVRSRSGGDVNDMVDPLACVCVF